MFVETIRSTKEQYRHWDERLQLSDHPPPALVANIAWANSDGTITAVHVWDTPQAVGDFYLERVRLVVEAEGEPADKPVRHGTPVHVYLRERHSG